MFYSQQEIFLFHSVLFVLITVCWTSNFSADTTLKLFKNMRILSNDLMCGEIWLLLESVYGWFYLSLQSVCSVFKQSVFNRLYKNLLKLLSAGSDTNQPPRCHLWTVQEAAWWIMYSWCIYACGIHTQDETKGAEPKWKNRTQFKNRENSSFWIILKPNKRSIAVYSFVTVNLIMSIVLVKYRCI